MKILLVEDSRRLQKSVGQGLEKLGFAVDVVGDGRDGLAFAQATDYDCVILDLMLPGMSGPDVLRALRHEDRQTSILILSAKDRVADRIQGLEIGADDYLIKPFAFDELVARLRALIRRRYEHKNPVISLGSLELNLALHALRCGGVILPLTPRELSILEHLAIHRGQVISAKQLEDHIYDSNAVVSRNAIEAHVSGLRKKLNAAGEPGLVKTRRGFGYYVE